MYKMMTYLTFSPSRQSTDTASCQGYLLDDIKSNLVVILEVSNCYSNEGKSAMAWENKNINVLDKINEASMSSQVFVQMTLLENRLFWNYI